jgi:hypothetical protein
VTKEIEIEGHFFPASPQQQPPLPFDQRLRKIDQLHKDGLITEEEYARKRQEIMDSTW